MKKPNIDAGFKLQNLTTFSNNPQILYFLRAIDEYRRDAVRKLEGLRVEHVPSGHTLSISIN
jgi:hypothetical protein